MNARMAELGEKAPGYLGRESMSDGEGRDLTVIYYRDAEAIAAWQADPEHLEAQRLGRGGGLGGDTGGGGRGGWGGSGGWRSTRWRWRGWSGGMGGGRE